MHVLEFGAKSISLFVVELHAPEPSSNNLKPRTRYTVTAVSLKMTSIPQAQKILCVFIL